MIPNDYLKNIEREYEQLMQLHEYSGHGAEKDRSKMVSQNILRFAARGKRVDITRDTVSWNIDNRSGARRVALDFYQHAITLQDSVLSAPIEVIPILWAWMKSIDLIHQDPFEEEDNTVL